MSVRSVLGMATAAMLSGALFLSSCTSPTAPAPSGTAATDTKPYGGLTVAIQFYGENLDPQISTETAFQLLSVPMFDSLTELTSEYQPRPGLAERWEISPDGLTHTFYLRKGVKFHDGSDLTAVDAKFSIERILAPESTTSAAPQLRAGIASLELKDDYTLVIHMKQPAYELLTAMAQLSGTTAVVPKKYIEEKGVDYFRRNPVGSGPWKFVKYEPGTRLELEAVESHWRAVPKFKNLTLLNVKEAATVIAMLKTGELDMAVELSPDSVPALKSAGLRVVTQETASQYYAYMFYDLQNPGKYALGDVRVRKALSLAVDRKELGDKMYGGYAEPLFMWFVPPKSSEYYDPSIMKPDPYDLEGAKKLLAEAGRPSGFSLKFWSTGGGGVFSSLDQAVAGYWRKVGVEASIAPIDYAALTPKFRPKQTPEVWDTLSTVRSTSPVLGFERMAIAYHSTKSFHMNMNNPRLDKLIDDFPLTRDPAERKKMAIEAIMLAKNEYSKIPLLELQTPLALGSRVGDLKPLRGVVALGPIYDTITHAR